MNFQKDLGLKHLYKDTLHIHICTNKSLNVGRLHVMHNLIIHSPLEPLLGQIQIAKAAIYAKRCAKMSTLRNAWFENAEKKVFLEKSHFMKNTVHFFFKFSILQEKV